MLATSGKDKNVKLFDKRESKIVQTFDGIHTGNIFLFNKIINDFYIGSIYCVRWSPRGDMIATASGDETVALLDFKTGKLYTGGSFDASKFTLFE